MPGFALLAPVPRQHVSAALDVLRTKEFVCFGSDSWDAFSTLDIGAKTYIYVSHTEDDGEIEYEAVYRGTVNKPPEMRKLEREGFRPATTIGEKWGFFWKVSDIKPVKTPLPISRVQLPSGKYLKSYPRGPIQVAS